MRCAAPVEWRSDAPVDRSGMQRCRVDAHDLRTQSKWASLRTPEDEPESVSKAPASIVDTKTSLNTQCLVPNAVLA